MIIEAIDQWRACVSRALTLKHTQRLGQSPVLLRGMLRFEAVLLESAAAASTAAAAAGQLPPLMAALEMLDALVAQAVDEWLGLLQEALHQAIIARHGQWLHDPATAATPWIHRLQTPLAYEVAANTATACAVAAICSYLAPHLALAAEGAGHAAMAAVQMALVVAPPVSMVLGPVVHFACTGSTLPRTAYFAALAATEMDDSFERVRDQLMEAYRDTVRRPMRSALAAVKQQQEQQRQAAQQQLVVIGDEGGAALLAAAALGFGQAATGVQAILANVGAICQPLPALGSGEQLAQGPQDRGLQHDNSAITP